MGYLHIDNLYKNQQVLMFKRAYALEKIHGTSAHVAWDKGVLRFFSGEQNSVFVTLFDHAKLTAVFHDTFGPDAKVVVYGEHFGGKIQGCAALYGKDQRFLAFDVKVGDSWLSVPAALAVVEKLGLHFVDFEEVDCTTEELDRCRDKFSHAASQAGVHGKTGEGIVVRPLIELTDSRGTRVIAKHKRDDYRETKTPRPVVDLADMKVLEDAEAVADEWVTSMRLEHALQKLPHATELRHTSEVVKYLQDDVKREGEGEIVWNKAVERAVGKAAAKIFKAKIATIHAS